MKKFFFTLGLVFVFLASVSLAQDSPLVEAAKKEKERRAKVKGTKVFTNQDIQEFKKKNNIEDEEEVVSTEEEGEPESAGAEKTPKTAAKEKEKEKDLSMNEEYWRGRYQNASARVQQAQEKVNQLQSDINSLNQQFYAEGDGVGQRPLIESERGARLTELEAAKAELEQARQDFTNLEEEARRAGAPPGWVRD